MSLSGECEEGGPASKRNRSEEYEERSEAHRCSQRSGSPVPSCVSMKSSNSMIDPPDISSSEPVPLGMREHRSQLQRPASPKPSGVSMKSSNSMIDPPDIRSSEPVPFDLSREHRSRLQRPASPKPSGVSMKSSNSMIDPPDIRSSEPVPFGLSGVSMKRSNSMIDPPDISSSEPVPLGMRKHRSQLQRPASPEPSGVSMKSSNSMIDPPDIRGSRPMPFDSRCFLCEQNWRDPVSISCGHSFCRQCISTYWEQCRPGDYACPQCRKRSKTRPVLQRHKKSDFAPDDPHLRIIQSQKTTLKNRYTCFLEGVTEQGNNIPLNRIYTELYITVGEGEVVNAEHEVLQMDIAYKRRTSNDAPINCNDIFKPVISCELSNLGKKEEQGKEDEIRTVVTKGIAGIGKTVSVQKFVLDWAEGKANQDIDFMFVFSFRELNLMSDAQYSLHGLLLVLYPELKELDPKSFGTYKMVFILDGLDESTHPLDFCQSLFDVTKKSSISVLISNLIEGNLLPSAHVWITSRPAAVSQIPSQFITRVTEVQGFNDSQKEEYFRRRICDQRLADKVISHIKKYKSLHIMCHIPVFCWISSTALQDLLQSDKDERLSKTLTEMYCHFLLIQTKIKNQKFEEGDQTEPKNLLQSNKEVLMKLAELAFKQLIRGNIVFYQEDLTECDIDVREATVYSGMCTDILKEETMLSQKNVYSFIHLSVQEFLASIYVFSCYITKKMEALKDFLEGGSTPSEKMSLDVLLKKTVEKALQSRNGHLDLFIRFLHGISVEHNQKLLEGLLTHIESDAKSIERAIENLKKMQKKNIHPERWLNLLHCLAEMNYYTIHEEICVFLKSQTHGSKLSAMQCSALAYMYLTSEETLDEFDLQKYNTSGEGRKRLLPAVRCCRKALLAGCKLCEPSCETIASALRATNSSLVELDLSYSELQDSTLRTLSDGLQSPCCKLEILKLIGCKLTDRACEGVASALQSPDSLLKVLDMSNNDLQDSGAHALCVGLEKPLHRVEILRLASCKFTTESCETIALVMKSAKSTLRELDLSNNDLQDSGVKQLASGLEDTHCQLKILRLSGCSVTEEGCSCLASALSLNPSHLRELDLSFNHPGVAGVKLLSARVEDLHFELETLNVDSAGIGRIKRGPRKYACDLTLDTNTAHAHLTLSEENRKATATKEEQPYPSHPDRFKYSPQVLCRESLSERCYWEAEWTGVKATIGVAYKGINRKGWSDTGFGNNEKSWGLEYSFQTYAASHNKSVTEIPAPKSSASRIGVYLDWPAGTLSFYSVSSDSNTLTHLHTFSSTFTEPLYAGFGVNESVSLCRIESVP